MTDPQIPSVEQLRTMLARCSGAQLAEVERQSGVSIHTLWKIRRGETTNPGIETVRVFYPHLSRLAARPESPPVAVEVAR